MTIETMSTPKYLPTIHPGEILLKNLSDRWD